MCFAFDIVFVPPEGVASHFCGSALSCTASSSELGAPKGWPRLSKNPVTSPMKKQGRAPGKWLRTEKTKDCQPLPSFSCDLSLSFSAHLTSYISFSSFGNEGRGNMEQAWERQMFQIHKFSANSSFASYLQPGNSWQWWICRDLQNVGPQCSFERQTEPSELRGHEHPHQRAIETLHCSLEKV